MPNFGLEVALIWYQPKAKKQDVSTVAKDCILAD